jgi:hypothetical protein
MINSIIFIDLVVALMKIDYFPFCYNYLHTPPWQVVRLQILPTLPQFWFVFFGTSRSYRSILWLFVFTPIYRYYTATMLYGLLSSCHITNARFCYVAVVSIQTVSSH